jgi:hypothetical protein
MSILYFLINRLGLAPVSKKVKHEMAGLLPLIVKNEEVKHGIITLVRWGSDTF